MALAKNGLLMTQSYQTQVQPIDLTSRRPMRDARAGMRTTLDIGDDVLRAVRSLAASEQRTQGEILTELARNALTPQKVARVRNGVPLLPVRRSKSVDLQFVNAKRDEK
jgi:hypothetical protein